MFWTRYSVLRPARVATALILAAILAAFLMLSMMVPQSTADPVDGSDATDDSGDSGDLIVPTATPEVPGESTDTAEVTLNSIGGFAMNNSGGGGGGGGGGHGTSFPVEMVTVSAQAPCNPAEPTTQYGQVCYSYQIGKYEITNWQYAAFLNAVATASDPHELWHPSMANWIQRAGSPPAYTYSTYSSYQSYPARCITGTRAMRFCNWLHNGRLTGTQGAASTESGAYNPANTFAGRLPLARWALLTRDEWYKAAFYSPPSTYYLYPVGNGISGSEANYGNLHGGAQQVGYYPLWPSLAWGTFDQGGNVDECLSPNMGSVSLLGGNYTSSETQLRNSAPPVSGYLTGPGDATTGFRVVFLPDTDSDGDGTRDCDDGCPNDSNKTAPGVCGCGVPDTDSDADGTPDCNDGCPDDPLKTAPGACGCGLPDTGGDSDQDGVWDCRDNCPQVANALQQDIDGDTKGDMCDNCPTIPNANQADDDNDGVGNACSTGSTIQFILELGGNNHNGVGPFTPGTRAPMQHFLPGQTITWDVRVAIYGRHRNAAEITSRFT